jgi:hypothetical protein
MACRIQLKRLITNGSVDIVLWELTQRRAHIDPKIVRGGLFGDSPLELGMISTPRAQGRLPPKLGLTRSHLHSPDTASRIGSCGIKNRGAGCLKPRILAISEAVGTVPSTVLPRQVASHYGILPHSRCVLFVSPEGLNRLLTTQVVETWLTAACPRHRPPLVAACVSPPCLGERIQPPVRREGGGETAFGALGLQGDRHSERRLGLHTEQIRARATVRGLITVRQSQGYDDAPYCLGPLLISSAWNFGSFHSSKEDRKRSYRYHQSGKSMTVNPFAMPRDRNLRQ